MANVYDDDEETLRFADEGDYLDERYLIDRAEHEAHAEGNEEEPEALEDDGEILPETCDECETRGVNCSMHS